MGVFASVKKAFKRVLPPPVSSFMREVDNLNDSIWRSKGETHGQVEMLSRRVEQAATKLESSRVELARLTDLFESSNRENLRLFFELQKQHEEELAFNVNVLSQFKVLCKENEKLLGQLDAVVRSNYELLERVEVLDARCRELSDAQSDGFARVLRGVGSVSSGLETSHGLIRRTMNRQDELLDPSLYGQALKAWYLEQTGKVLDLDHPVTYNEKVQWAKLFDTDPRKTLLADKYAVREWVSRLVGDQYLIPLIAVYDRAENIDFNELPQSFVLKANHGSGWNAIVRNKDEENLEAIRRKAAKWLKTDFSFANGYEMHYRNIPRKLMVEEYIHDGNGSLPDYKFWCFDGKVYYIEYIADRQTDIKMAFFDTAWNRQDFLSGYPPCDCDISKPLCLDEMIQLAETLASDFSHVRVDLYLLDNSTIKFGEMTFSTASGVCRWSPSEADKLLGDLYKLPFNPED